MDETAKSQIIRLVGRIARVEGKGPPLRQLTITCAMTNPTPNDICVLDAWVKVETLSGLTIAEGKLLHMEHALAFPPVVTAPKEATAKINIPLPNPVIHQLELLRGGSDLSLRIHSKILATIVSDSPTNTLFRPVQTIFEDRGHTGYIEHTIPQSDWVKLLRTIRWSELELVELPACEIRGDQRLARALRRLEDAQDCYRRGLWEESIANCRKVFEALIKDVGGKDTLAESTEVLESIVDPKTKAETINSLVLALTKFTHLARHEQLPQIPITPADAALSLRISSALLSFLAGQ